MICQAEKLELDTNGVVKIKLAIQSGRKDVEIFLNGLKEILTKEDFNIETDLMVIVNRKSGEKECFSTAYTLVDLEYDSYDIVDELKQLTVKNYSETLLDRDNPNPPLLYVFGKVINNTQVYIKLKIKGDNNKYVLCVSFHYAENLMNFPYV